MALCHLPFSPQSTETHTLQLVSIWFFDAAAAATATTIVVVRVQKLFNCSPIQVERQYKIREPKRMIYDFKFS